MKTLKKATCVFLSFLLAISMVPTAPPRVMAEEALSETPSSVLTDEGVCKAFAEHRRKPGARKLEWR